MRPWLILAAVLAAFPALAVERSHKALRDFAKQEACPSTGRHEYPCPGYVADHLIPLCANGRDRPENLQWQERAVSLDKDREERALCRALARREIPQDISPAALCRAALRFGWVQMAALFCR